MIRFACENCGHKISVHQENAGRRGKCPKCKRPVIVPKKSNTILIKCENCEQKVSVPRKYSGRKGRCPNCKNPIIIPGSKTPVYKPKKEKPEETASRFMGDDVGLTLLEVPEELKLQEPEVEQDESKENDIEQELVEEAESVEPEPADQRRLPWFIDIFLYPVSMSGLIHLAVFSGIFILTATIKTLMFITGRILTLGGILIGLYMAWYFAECVRDSAKGRTRAPEAFALAGLGEMWEQMQHIIGCYLIFITPSVIIYPLIFHKQDVFYWMLLLTGSFFFPMALLACIMFDSIRGLNPILLIGSIFSTFFQYCGLVLLIVGIVFAFTKLTSMFGSENPQEFSLEMIIIGGVFFFLSVYIAFIIAHLIGRFYWRNEEKLNWEC